MWYRIEHQPSGDEADAEGKEAAILAARTLLEDNEFQGSCRIFAGEAVVDVVWADDADSYVDLTTKW